MKSISNSILGFQGMTAVPSLGVAIAVDDIRHSLIAFRLVDGVPVGSLDVQGLNDITADPKSGAIFGVVESDDMSLVSVVNYSWTLDSGFVAERVVSAAGTRSGVLAGRPVVVVPPAPGLWFSYLVIGTEHGSELLVLSLPSLALVHTHRLEGIHVHSLAASPWGETLAVVDGISRTIHVLAWPLPGMPELD